MTTYLDIPSTDVDADSPINVSLMERFRDNVLAIIEGDATAVAASKQIANAAFADQTITGAKLVNNTITATQILASTIDTTELAAGAVHQSDLDTSDGFVTNAVNSVDTYTLPGGSYGFYPQIKVGDATVVQWDYYAQIFDPVDDGDLSETYLTTISLKANPSSDAIYAQQRYVNSSPPFDIGDGEIPLFVFLKMKGNEVAGTYSADVPPWAYNGPTNITGKLRHGKKYQTKRTLNKDTGEVTQQEIEVTNEIKNADMGLIPHPFVKTRAGETIVMLDPCETLSLYEMQRTGESIADLVASGYIKVSNQSLNRCTPNGVQAVDFTWRNTGKRPVGLIKP